VPQRTNAFQELIALIHRQLAPAGAVVTESSMDPDPVTGEPRETDITIEYEVAGYPMTLIVECRDHGRAADVKWIDELVGKYLSKASQVVAVSSRGFTEPAIAKAKAIGIQTMTIEEASDTDWRRWVEELDSIWISMDAAIMKSVFNIEAVDKSLHSLLIPAGTAVGDIMFAFPNGERLSAWDIFDRHLNDPRSRTALAASERRPDGLVKYRLGLPTATVLLPPAGGEPIPVEGIGYMVEHEIDTIRVPLKPGEYNLRSVATGSGQGREWTVRIALVRDASGEPRMNLRLNRNDGMPRQGKFSVYGLGEPLPSLPYHKSATAAQ
jgi:hypothetical protein